ncbi:MAG: PQQ-dependent sugar dehydrogenase [Rhodothalassiaceae bacterium]
MFKSLAALLVLAVPAAAKVPTPVETIGTEAGNIKVTEVAGGFNHPWGIEILPDGRALVTEKPGRLRLISADGQLQKAPIGGTPQVWANGQGGLLDVVADPNFQNNQLIWLSFAEPGDGDSAGTAVGRGRLADGRLEDFQTVWRQTTKVTGPNHFGSRIAFEDDDILFVTLGDRYKFQPAQELSNTLGSVIRITRKGQPAEGNPFLDRDDAEPEIFSYGHRNIQAAALNPKDQTLYVAEMGPLGGDELNKIKKGVNYGWPVVSWGTDYDGEDIPDPPTHPEFEDALAVWTPVIAPSGMIFYQGDAFSAFQGDALIGGLVSQGLSRVRITGDDALALEHIPLGQRIRDVAEDAQGHLYVLIDRADGMVWKLQPLSADAS